MKTSDCCEKTSFHLRNCRRRNDGNFLLPRHFTEFE